MKLLILSCDLEAGKKRRRNIGDLCQLETVQGCPDSAVVELLSLDLQRRLFIEHRIPIVVLAIDVHEGTTQKDG